MEGWTVRVSLEDIEANGIGDEEEDENDDEEDPEDETDDESREYVSDYGLIGNRTSRHKRPF